ncbi:GIY-YIG nuclease family protein [Ferruginibacter sp. HRS2-29]|uniref:GIY-YIG nuclease family protein n=1 Tax=Ferruginibacter sp. HRS2-29 TaxID=2487334 RepID=UPI0020CCE3E7|nr:GIY-YIG nuclease family protein [Ferruginibacter sp. HRS2-29]MCP9750732.1 GIY-YIG nuclease family protein [Ferruginibacter sp. HRS2-29]
MYYVYILRSDVDQSFYKGYTENPAQRLIQHNNGESVYTRNKIPWKLVYVEVFSTKKEALIREKNLKKATHQRIESLISHPKNIVGQFG